MKPIFILLSLIYFSQSTLWSQEKNELNTIQKYQLNSANKQYLKGNKEEAINTYNSILTKKPTNSTTLFNTGAALQQNGNIEESRKVYDAAINNSIKPSLKAKANYNVGNSFMKEEKWEEAIKHYKSSLKQNPNDEEAKYNLAYANAKLKQQQQQDKDNKKDKNQDKQDQDQQDKDKQDQQKEQNQDQQEQDRKDQQQQQPKRMSKAEAEKNMKALREKEKKLHQKNNEKEGNAIKSTNEKDW